MKMTVLMDNTTIIDTPFLGESGLSFLIETDDAKILFDTGFSPLFLSNARKMGINLTDLTGVCISHGHNDHTNGLPALGKLLKQNRKRIPIMLHPACLQKKWWRNKDGILEEIGMPCNRENLEELFDIICTETPKMLGANLYLLGSIPRNDLAANEPIGLVANGQKSVNLNTVQDGDTAFAPDYAPDYSPDYVVDDTAMVFDGKEGLVVINGCAHSGLVNILAYVTELFPGKPVTAVIGGFHMLNKDQAWLEDMSQKVKAYDPKRVYPCHCTDEASRAYLRKNFSVGMIGVGSVLLFE